MTDPNDPALALWGDHPSGRFVARTLDDGSPFAVWVPAAQCNGAGWPVILALHGSGERGHDGRQPTTLGLGPVLPSLPTAGSAVVVFPQATPDEHWRGAAGARALRALEATLAEFDGDPSRVALTGLSLGGNGAWHLALAEPTRFSALAVVCGWVEMDALPNALRTPHVDPYQAVAERLRHLPTWVFHGTRDTVVPVEASRRLVDALHATGSPVRYTEYPEVGHSAWAPAYREPDLLAWLCRGGVSDARGPAAWTGATPPAS